MSKLRDAATVVVVRQGQKALEVFLMRRHHGHDFMANAWVFPGGRVDAADRDLTLARRMADFDADAAARRLGTDAETAVSLYAAALRETFEEAGLLLANRRGDETMLTFDGDAVRQRFEALREQVDTGALSIAELCCTEDLVLQTDQMVYFAHWITPHFEKKRYDTRFFIAKAPPQQRPSHDDAELTHSAWWSPGEAIERYRDGEILLAPPTLRVLEDLGQFDSPDQALTELARMPAPPAILPCVADGADEMTLLLPGDRDYPADAPRLAAATPIADGVTRMILRDGQWFSQQT